MESDQLTLCLEASPAKTSRAPEEETESKGDEVASSSTSCESFAWYDRATSSWRTYQCSLLETAAGGCQLYSGSWPRAGTMQNGIVSQRQPLAPLTAATEYSSWPTPNANPTRPNEGNVRFLRAKVLAGDLSEQEAKGMLDGKSPFTPQGKLGEYVPPALLPQQESPHEVVTGGKLNPTFVEWLMGFPLGWTVCEPSETP